MGSNGGIELRLGVWLAFLGLDHWLFNCFDCWKWWNRELDRCKIICSDCQTTAQSLGQGLDDDFPDLVVCSNDCFIYLDWLASLPLDLD